MLLNSDTQEAHKKHNIIILRKHFPPFQRGGVLLLLYHSLGGLLGL